MLGRGGGGVDQEIMYSLHYIEDVQNVERSLRGEECNSGLGKNFQAGAWTMGRTSLILQQYQGLPMQFKPKLV